MVACQLRLADMRLYMEITLKKEITLKDPFWKRTLRNFKNCKRKYISSNSRLLVQRPIDHCVFFF